MHTVKFNDHDTPARRPGPGPVVRAPASAATTRDRECCVERDETLGARWLPRRYYYPESSGRNSLSCSALHRASRTASAHIDDAVYLERS